MREFRRLKVAWRVVRTWQGTKEDERHLKASHNLVRYCPRCQGRLSDEEAKVVAGKVLRARKEFERVVFQIEQEHRVRIKEGDGSDVTSPAVQYLVDEDPYYDD
jgi:hypothetical protein